MDRRPASTLRARFAPILLLVALLSIDAGALAADGTPDAAPSVDRLVLKDGRTLEGRIEGEDTESYALRMGGALRLVNKTDVAETLRAPANDPPAPPPSAGTDNTGGAGTRGKRDKPATDDSGDGKRRRRMDDRDPALDSPTRSPATMSPELTRWVSGCIGALGSGEPTVARSAAQALESVGPPALPAIRAARQGADPFLLRILEGVERAIQADSADPAPTDGAERRIRAIVDRARRDFSIDDAGVKALKGALGRFSREFMETLADVRDGLLAPAEAIGAVESLRTRLRDDLKSTLTAEQIRGVDTILDELASRLRKGAGAGVPPVPDKAPEPERPAKSDEGDEAPTPTPEEAPGK